MSVNFYLYSSFQDRDHEVLHDKKDTRAVKQLMLIKLQKDVLVVLVNTLTIITHFHNNLAHFM